MNIFIWWTELARSKPALRSIMLHRRWSRMPSSTPSWYLLLFATHRCWSSRWRPRRCTRSTWPRTNTFLGQSIGWLRIRRPVIGCAAGGHPRTLESSRCRTNRTSWASHRCRTDRTGWASHRCTTTAGMDSSARHRGWYDTRNFIPQVLHI
jgi:hypothetical protein